MCRLTVPNREWPGLLEWLHQLSSAASEHHRQAALHIFSSLTQVIGAPPNPHFHNAILLCELHKISYVPSLNVDARLHHTPKNPFLLREVCNTSLQS